MEIVTESGKSIKGTYNHPLLAVRKENGHLIKEWRRLDQFKVGDRVAVVAGYHCNVTGFIPTGFKPIVRSRFGPKFHRRLPEKVTPELGAFLGHMLSDGWVCKDGYRFGFVVAEPELDVLPRLRALAKGLFGFEPGDSETVKKGRKVHLHYVYLSDKDVSANLAFLRTKRVPEMVMASGNRVVVAFLRWLYEADGTVFNKGRGRRAVGLKAKDIELLRDVQLLLLRFGIHSRIVGNALLIRRGRDIIAFRNKVGFVSQKKCDLLNSLAEDAKSFGRFRRQMSERIVSIILHPPEDVFDIEVPDGHRFIANGIVSHNTAKSELLKYVARIAPRGLYTTGRGSTAAGLTAAVVKEKSGLMMLEAGAVVLADQGVACLHPDTRLVFDNKILSVDELQKGVTYSKVGQGESAQEVGILPGELASLDQSDYSMKANRSTKIRRRMHWVRLIQLIMRSGNTIKVTKDHLLLDGNSLEWKHAGSFSVGEYVTAPLRIPGPRYDQLFLWDVLPDECVVSLTGEQKTALRDLILSSYSTLADAARGLGLPRIPNYYRSRLQPTLGELKKLTSALGVAAEWKARTYTYDRCEVRTSTLTPELAYVCGFVKGDAAVKISKRRAQMVVTQSAKHQQYIDHFQAYWERIFGALSFRRRPSVFRTEGHETIGERVDWSVGKRVFGRLYEYLTANSLANVLTLPDEAMRGFLAGLMDSDGYIGRKTCSKDGVSYQTWNAVYEISSDADTNLNLLLALRRFGVVGHYAGVRQGVGVVVVSSRSDVARLSEELKDYSLKGGKVPGEKLHDVSGISEKAPAKVVQALFDEAFGGGPTQEFLKEGTWSTIYSYRNLVRQPSVGQVLKVFQRHQDVPASALRKLEALVKKEYFLDEIVGIEEIPYEGPVYDLVMEGAPNFVANGVIVHNCIDEFDKMRAEDRGVLHEVMEQQTVSVAKGGIVATLNARTSILAAANPVFGKYDPYKNIYENVSLPTPLLSRFDLVFIIRDIPDRAKDEKLASHILETHRSEAFLVQPPLDFAMLRKYLIYAKKIQPKLTKEAQERLLQFYLDLRSASTEGTIAITPRQLEGLIRLSTARARLFLREKVTVEDALQAIALMRKMLESVGIDVRTGKVDLGVLQGRPASERNILEKAMDVFRQLYGPDQKPVEAKVFVDELVKTGDFSAEEARRVISTLYKLGQIYEVRSGYYGKIS